MDGGGYDGFFSAIPASIERNDCKGKVRCLIECNCSTEAQDTVYGRCGEFAAEASQIDYYCFLKQLRFNKISCPVMLNCWK